MKKKRVGHKPDSVKKRVIYLGLLLPKVSCGTPKTEQEKDQPLPLRPCSQPGFTEPVPHDTAGALLIKLSNFVTKTTRLQNRT